MSVLSLEQEIATYLAGAVTTPVTLSLATNLFYAAFPDEPDLCVGVIATGGLAPIMTLTGSGAAESKIDRGSFQVRVRAGMTDYTDGAALIQAVYKALQGVTETVINGGANQLFHLITALQPPHYLGRGSDVDERQRHNWVQNFMATFDDAAR